MPEGEVNIMANTAASFGFGTLYGAAIEAWKAGPQPGSSATPRVVYAQLANNIGKTSLQFAVLGGLYSTGAVVARSARDKDDSLNYGFGGLLAGIFLGMRAGTVHQVVLKGITLAGAGIFCSFVGGKFSGSTRSADSELISRFSYLSAADSAKDK